MDEVVLEPTKANADAIIKQRLAMVQREARASEARLRAYLEMRRLKRRIPGEKPAIREPRA